MELNEVKEKAQAVLEGNLVAGENFFYTCPSTGTYQHQWLWDSCFHAIVWTYFDPENAKRELLSMVANQHDNGMISHMNHVTVSAQKPIILCGITKPSSSIGASGAGIGGGRK